jgi:hypothetical protein
LLVAKVDLFERKGIAVESPKLASRACFSVGS